MTYTNRGGFGGNGGGRGQFFDKRGGDRGFERQMFDATCARCGRPCKVPFRPNGSKDVFCSECFEENNGGSSRDSRSFSRSSRDNVGTYFSDRPKRESFSHSQSSRGNSVEMEMISEKLDKIIELLSTKPTKKVKKTVAE